MKRIEIIEDADMSVFQNCVNAALSMGAELHGPVSVWYDPSADLRYFVQAVIFYDKDDGKPARLIPPNRLRRGGQVVPFAA